MPRLSATLASGEARRVRVPKKAGSRDRGLHRSWPVITQQEEAVRVLNSPRGVGSVFRDGQVPWRDCSRGVPGRASPHSRRAPEEVDGCP